MLRLAHTTRFVALALGCLFVIQAVWANESSAQDEAAEDPNLAAREAEARAAQAAEDAIEQEQEVMWVAYEGELLDQNNAPISGVFAMTFELYRSMRATEPVWVEVQFVAVVEGRYRVFLGRTSGVPKAWEEQERVLAVQLGEGEIARHDLLLLAYADPEEVGLPLVQDVGPVELAGQAIEAERAVFANECRALDGRSAEELDRFEQLMERVTAIRQQLDASRTQRVSRDTVAQPRIGGPGGVRYQRTCPPGFVMTGARGGTGNLVDGFRVVCTELL